MKDYSVSASIQIAQDEMSLEQAQAVKTANGTPYGALSDDWLQFIIDNAKNPQKKRAAEIVLKANKETIYMDLLLTGNDVDIDILSDNWMY